MLPDTSKLIYYDKIILECVESKYKELTQKQLKMINKADKLKDVLKQTMITCIKEVILIAEKAENYEECFVLSETLKEPEVIDEMLQIWWVTAHNE